MITDVVVGMTRSVVAKPVDAGRWPNDHVAPFEYHTSAFEVAVS